MTRVTSNISTLDIPLRDELTVVTAYFNIGSFPKGFANVKFTPDTYTRWLQIFDRIESPVIAYFDLDSNLELFAQIRKNLPPNLTVIHKVDRGQVGKLNSFY